MKDELLTWAENADELDTVAAFILYKMAQFADAECCGWAAVAVLAKAVRKSERTVQYRLRDLEAGGYIARTGRMHRVKNSSRSVPIYQLAPDVEGLGTRRSMGAEAAPIGAHGCKNGGSMGAAVCTRKEPTEPTTERATALSVGASERASFDLGLDAYPVSGRGVTDEGAAWEAWVVAATLCGGGEALVACVRAYAADPALKRRDYGAPSMQRWLREKRFRAYLPATRAGAGGAGLGEGRTAFAGPPELRAEVVRLHGAAKAGSYLDPCGWDAEGRVVVARTRVAASWLRQNMAGALSAQAARVEHRQDQGA